MLLLNQYIDKEHLILYADLFVISKFQNKLELLWYFMIMFPFHFSGIALAITLTFHNKFEFVKSCLYFVYNLHELRGILYI